MAVEAGQFGQQTKEQDRQKQDEQHFKGLGWHGVLTAITITARMIGPAKPVKVLWNSQPSR
jgi:hypothetical protein